MKYKAYLTALLDVKTNHEQEAVEWFKSLSNEQKLAQIKFRYEDWLNDQQKAYQGVVGE